MSSTLPIIGAKNGTKRWCLNGKLHRVDVPAVEKVNGTKYWYLNGKLHRTDGPAIEFAGGAKRWYLNGKKYSLNEFVIAVNWSDEDIVMWKLSAT